MEALFIIIFMINQSANWQILIKYFSSVLPIFQIFKIEYHFVCQLQSVQIARCVLQIFSLIS